MQYVEGFVAAVPSNDRDSFRRHAEQVAEAFKERGALRVVECRGTDVLDGFQRIACGSRPAQSSSAKEAS